MVRETKLIWLLFRDCAGHFASKNSIGRYVTALKCLNQTILFYLLPRKLYSSEIEWRQTAKNARVEQSTWSNFIAMPLGFCFIHKILDFKKCHPLLDIGNGYYKGKLFGQVCHYELEFNSELSLVKCPCCFKRICCCYAFPSSPLRLCALSIVNWGQQISTSRDCFLSVRSLGPGVAVFLVVLRKKK